VPTTRPRHTITETDEIARALDVAERRWPGESRSRLLAHLVEAGAEALEDERQRRLRAIEETAGIFEDVYPPGYLEELRKDWPD
jgi:hypothetical protein